MLSQGEPRREPGKTDGGKERSGAVIRAAGMRRGGGKLTFSLSTRRSTSESPDGLAFGWT
jgi:hypothetical protein